MDAGFSPGAGSRTLLNRALPQQGSYTREPTRGLKTLPKRAHFGNSAQRLSGARPSKIQMNALEDMIENAIAQRAEVCTECGKPSDGVRCCGTNHPTCEDCCSILADGYHYCPRHVQGGRDEIAERETYAALANLRNVCLTQSEQAYRCRELIANLARLAGFYMNSLKPE